MMLYPPGWSGSESEYFGHKLKCGLKLTWCELGHIVCLLLLLALQLDGSMLGSYMSMDDNPEILAIVMLCDFFSGENHLVCVVFRLLVTRSGLSGVIKVSNYKVCIVWSKSGVGMAYMPAK